MRTKIIAVLLAVILLLAVGCSQKTAVQEEPAQPQVSGSSKTGIKLSFETVDVNGNSISSSELFAANKVTMVNIWASWCPPCVGELPELQSLNAELSEMGCGIIGVLTDGTDKNGLADGIEIMNETGVTYPVILPWKTFDSDLPISAYPTSLFIDSEGNVLNVKPIVGAYPDRYKDAVEQALALTAE